MKTIILSACLILLFMNVFSQDKNDTIKKIDQEVQFMKIDSNYWITTKYNETFLDTGFIRQAGKGFGQLTGFFKNGMVCRIQEIIGIKLLSDVAITEYYFSDGKLIFVYESESYGPSILIDSSGTVDKKLNKCDFEGSYYFNDDKMFKSITKGKQQILPNELYFDSQSKEGQLMLSAEKYKSLLSVKLK